MPQSTEGVLIVIGAVFFLIGVLGGGLEISAIKIPPLERLARWLILAMGLVLLLIGIFRVLFPPAAAPATSVAIATAAPAPALPTATTAAPPTAPPPTPTSAPSMTAAPTSAATVAIAPTSTPTPALPSPTASPSPAPTSGATPAPTLSDTWREGDIVAKASLSSVSSNSFDLSLVLTNEGASDFTARFRYEDARVMADTGETYIPSNSPGQTADRIGPNQSRNYSFFFNGVLNPKAKELRLVLTPLSTLSALRVAVSLGRDMSGLNLAASLNRTSDSSIDVSFLITNEGGESFIAQFRGSDISLTDNTGKSYTLSSSVGQTTDSIGPNQSRNYSFFFRGPLNPKATSLVFRLAQLSGTPDVKLTIPVVP